jgi:hypothetical protein
VSDELKNANISHVNVDYDRKAQVVHLKGAPLTARQSARAPKQSPGARSGRAERSRTS